MKRLLIILLSCLLTLRGTASEPSHSRSLTELVEKLTSAVDQRDADALAELFRTSEASSEPPSEALAKIKECLKWGPCAITAGPKLDWLDRPYTYQGKKHALNGDYEATIYISPKAAPAYGIFIPAGRVTYRGYQLLLTVELKEGTPVPGKQGFIISPYSLGGADDARKLKPGDTIRDARSNRFYLVPTDRQSSTPH